MSTDKTFIPLRGNYRNLLIFQKAECIYDITFYFANKYLSKGDRTIDQMIQAARSGKQNIVEGCVASTTSEETEIKLINVAKASFQELIMDDEDYLRVRGMEQWSPISDKYRRTRKVCAQRNDSSFYREAIQNRTDETIANIAITLIHQEDVMLIRYLENIKRRFLEEGGIREEMTRGRLHYRKKQEDKGQ